MVIKCHYILASTRNKKHSGITKTNKHAIEFSKNRRHPQLPKPFSLCSPRRDRLFTLDSHFGALQIAFP
ncbi:hypothetical protein KM872_14080 [Brevibacterium luteolum]|nr:hypothetical protein [Brevibacterium luteolum]